jgi:hypothetical protein
MKSYGKEDLKLLTGTSATDYTDFHGLKRVARVMWLQVVTLEEDSGQSIPIPGIPE